MEASSSPFRITPTALFATLQLATLRDGSIAVPQNAKRILIEIGCSDLDTMDAQELSESAMRDAFLIAFEPYSTNNASRARQRAAAMVQPIARCLSDHPRGVALPIAVAPKALKRSYATINVSRIAGCSSLVPFNEAASGASTASLRIRAAASSSQGAYQPSAYSRRSA